MTRTTLHTPRDPLDFTPVPRRTRRDGWTIERQRTFIQTLADTGSLRVAAQSVGMSEAGAIYLRKQPGAESFCAAWDAAVASGSARVRERLIDHALNGIPEEVYHAGKLVGERRRFNHRSMMWIVENGEKRAAAAYENGGRAADAAKMRAAIEDRLDRLADWLARQEAETMAGHAEDPAERAAYELLHGPQDWAAFQAIARDGAAGDMMPDMPDLMADDGGQPCDGDDAWA